MRRIYRQLTNLEKDKIAVEFHLMTLDAIGVKYDVSKSTIHQVVTNYFKHRRIEIEGLTLTEIMDKYNVTVSRAIQLQMKFDRPLGGSVYFGKVKEAIYPTEQDMEMPEYSYEMLSDEEKKIWNINE